MARADEPLIYRKAQRFHRPFPFSGSNLWGTVSDEAVDRVVVGSAEFSVSITDNINSVAGRFHVHRDRLAHIRHDTNRRDEQSRWNRKLLAGGGVAIFVVETILAGDEGRTVGNGDVVTRPRCTYQAAKTIMFIGVSPN